MSDHTTVTEQIDAKFSSSKGLLRALGLLLADGAPRVGQGKTFWRIDWFFYGNSRNSETKSKKIVLKVGNEPSLQGLQKDRWQNLGSYGKNWIFGPKTEILGPKKSIHFLVQTMFWPRREKVPFSKINISLLRNFGCFFGIKRIFGPKNSFRLYIKTVVSL